MQTSIDPAILYADYQIGAATSHLPARERLAASHRYRALPLSMSCRRWAYHLGRYQGGAAPMDLDALLEAVLPRPRSSRMALRS